MTYSKFSIQYFRSFHNIQTLKFGIPVEGKLGSGLTFIVGENNAGKTTLIESLLLQGEDTIRSSEIIPGKELEFNLFNESDEVIKTIKLNRPNYPLLKEDPKLNKNIFELIPSRRHWLARISGSLTLVGVVNTASSQSPRFSSSNIEISSALKEIESDDSKYENFIKYVQNIIPTFSSFGIGNDGNDYIQYTTRSGVQHRTDLLGDGVISTIRILAHLFLGNPKPLLIDEPELSLHPQSQKKLFKLIAECSQERQIIIATHSPYFISWEYIKNGATLNKVTKFNDEKSEIHSLQEFSIYENLVKGANWQQPFLMDIVAKEIFFHDNILFVEGQEDVGLLNKYNDISEEVNLFGYGLRGKNSFQFALKLAKDLGIKKACVLLDNGSDESGIKSDLEKDFGKMYKIIQWNREYIRDKKPYTSSEKVGYFTEDGDKKSDLDDYNDKIKDINDYFN